MRKEGRRLVGLLSAQKHKYEIPKKLLWCSAAFRVLLCSEREVFLFGKREIAVRRNDVGSFEGNEMGGFIDEPC